MAKARRSTTISWPWLRTVRNCSRAECQGAVGVHRHSDIRTTYNRYGHLMPGGEIAAADRLSAFLDGSTAAVGRATG